MLDPGVSAFRGANIKVGALGDFLSLVQYGDIKPGSYLLVENVDRISRDNIIDAQMVFMGIINAGIVVVTLSNERAYSRESITRNQFEIFEIIMGFIRANDESATKAQRLRSAWHGKRVKLANGEVMTKIGPRWLRMKDDRSGFDVIEERAEIVRRIFKDTLNGVGQNPLARALNLKGVPVFDKTVGRTADRWHVKRLPKLTPNRRPILTPLM
jgi:DNA invertase Pin-like site-specific DNA recombinase